MAKKFRAVKKPINCVHIATVTCREKPDKLD